MKHLIKTVFGISAIVLAFSDTAEACGKDTDDSGNSSFCESYLTNQCFTDLQQEYEYCKPDATLLKDKKKTKENTKNGFDKKPVVGTKAYCPVMEADFEVMENSPHSVYKGKHYVFCCAPCKKKFDETPEKFI